jgi:hypothetical protein
MKKILASFMISKDKRIELYFSDIKYKRNYFYEPTKKLHRFDEVMVTYYYHNNRINLYRDTLDGAFLSLVGNLEKVKQGRFEKPLSIDVGKMVYALNESDKENANELYKDINFNNFWLWSTPAAEGAESFMYTYKGTLYLEIGLLYPWLYHEPDPSDPNYVLYQDFIKNYKPIAVEKISNETAMQWLNQCNALLKQIA